MQWDALLAALGAAVGFAVSTSLQHHAAARAPERAASAGRLLLHLIRQPRWLAGQWLALASFCLHAFALHLGALALVQPVVVSGIVFAVPVRAAMEGHRPPASEVRAVAITTVGLAVFLVASGPEVATGEPVRNQVALLALGVALVAAAVVGWAAQRTGDGHRRAVLYGVTAGVLFGVVAALVKLAARVVTDHGALGLATAWPAYGVVAVGLTGVALNQRAYRAGALSASMPILNIVNVLVALTLGLVVFHEVPAHSPFAVLAEGFALACIAYGLRGVAVQEAAEAEDDRVPVRT